MVKEVRSDLISLRKTLTDNFRMLEEIIDKVYSSCKEYKKIAAIRGEDEGKVREELYRNAVDQYLK